MRDVENVKHFEIEDGVEVYKEDVHKKDVHRKDVEVAEEDHVKKSKNITNVYREYFINKVFIPLVLLGITALVLILGWFFCPVCIVGVLVFSICTCAYVPILNIPLWISIAILMWQGWKITQGSLSLEWK